MGEIHIDLFTTLDGVAQAPGGRDEDREGGFEFGGWQAPLFDDLVHAEDGIDGSIAHVFNHVPKYVASRGTPALDWNGSQLLSPDVVGAVQSLRERHESIHVIGSLDFVQTLLREQLFDRLNLWVYPVVLGQGKKVFQGGEVPTSLRLAEPAVTGPSGAVGLRYELASGLPQTGDMDSRGEN